MYLPKMEMAFYFLVYISFLLYGIYQIYMLSDVISSKSKYVGFRNGWQYLNRKRDDLDFEWEAWKKFVWDNSFWFFLHLIASEMVRWRSPKHISYIHVAVSILFIVKHFNLSVLILILSKNFSFVVLMHFKRKFLIWIDALIWLFLVILFKLSEHQEKLEQILNLNESQCYELLIILSWNILKSISFSIDYITERDAQSNDKFDLVNVLGYALYFPNLLLGPLMIFGRYSEMTASNVTWTAKQAASRVRALIINVSKAGFCVLFTDFALHFIYLGNLQHNARTVELLSPWCLYTFGYLMGQFFHIKYVVFYGLGAAIAKYENIKAPGLPKCIGRIHLYSDMWKYFDQGLYEFLFIYIYTSLCQKVSSIQRKFFASFVTFSFIYLWHGVYQFVFIWSVVNFVCLQLEQFGRHIGRIHLHTFDKYLSQSNQNRLNAVCGSQLFIPAVISNFYFFAGVDVGNVFVYKTYCSGSFVMYLSLSFCCCCIYHVSELIQRWEVERSRKTLKSF